MTSPSDTGRPDGEPTDPLAELQRAVSEAVAVTESLEAGTDLATIGADADAVKARMISTRTTVAKAHKAAMDKLGPAKAEIERKRREMEDMLRQFQLDLAPLQEQMDRMADGIKAINLYTGRDEEIVTIRSGTPAPQDTPIVVRQLVLAMDEECAIAPEYEGIDYQQMHLFDEWVTADERHLDQVLPEKKGVVAILPRFKEKNYTDNALVNSILNAANFVTYWLIRNGDQLYRMTTDFSVGARLVPRRDEFTAMFKDRNGDTLNPDSAEWYKAEKLADQKTRHFMKVALILQGLIDRTTVFHPLPREGVSLLGTDDYDAGYVQLLADAEMAIETNRIPFRTWQREKNARLTAGQRIVGRFNRHDDRAKPRHAQGAPESLKAHIISSTSSDSFMVPFDRTDKIYNWDSRKYSEPQKKATWKVDRYDDSIIAIDQVTVAEMKMYLAARGERTAYITMFPILQAAIAFKEAEAAEEAPFRALLGGELGKITPDADTDSLVDDLIHWYKTANKWNRALNGDQAAEAKAARLILTEYKRRLKSGSTSEEMLKSLRDTYPTAVFIGQRTDGFVVIVPEPRNYPSFTTNVYAHRIDLTRTGKIQKEQRWTILTQSQRARWTPLFAADAWKTWAFGAKQEMHATDEQIAKLIDFALSNTRADGLVPMMIEVTDRQRYGFIMGSSAKVWAAPKKQATFNEAALLTSRTRHFSSVKRTFYWNLVSDAPFTLRDEWERDSWDPVGSHFHYWTSAGQNPPWASTWSRRELFEELDGLENVGWRDDAVIRDQYEKAQVWDSIWRKKLMLEHQADLLVESISEAWAARATEIAHARFVEDFGDSPELWEGHLKTVKVESPHDHHPYSKDGRSSLTWLAFTAIERGIDIQGLTVAEALVKVGPLPIAQAAKTFMGERPDPSTVRANGPQNEDELTLRFGHLFEIDKPADH